jgi:hypothetical protein
MTAVKALYLENLENTLNFMTVAISDAEAPEAVGFWWKRKR